MKAMEIADEFRAQFQVDPAFEGVALHNAQSTEDFDLSPGKMTIVFDVATKPMNGAGTAATYTLRAWAISTAYQAADTDPLPTAIHEQLIEKIRTRLLTQMSALRAALNATSTKFDFRGWVAAEPEDSQVKESHFQTPVVINGALLLI